MEAMRNSWTDGRLDDLSHRVDEGFRRTDEGFNRVDANLREMRTELASMRSDTNVRFEAMQRLLFQSSVLIVIALIGLIATQL